MTTEHVDGEASQQIEARREEIRQIVQAAMQGRTDYIGDLWRAAVNHNLEKPVPFTQTAAAVVDGVAVAFAPQDTTGVVTDVTTYAGGLELPADAERKIPAEICLAEIDTLAKALSNQSI